MIKSEFTIYKLGRTDKPITIKSIDGKTAGGLPFDRDKKMEEYKSLGYQVTPL